MHAMFGRRDTQKPSQDLLASFRRAFPRLPSFRSSSSRETQAPATPAATDTPGATLSKEFMSYDHGTSFEDTDDQPSAGGSLKPAPSGAPNSYANYGSFDFQSPVWQHTPAGGSGSGSGMFSSLSQNNFWQSSFNPGIPTPSSRSLSNPSSMNQLPAFLNLQDVHLQPQFSNLDYVYNPFSPAAGQAQESVTRPQRPDAEYVAFNPPSKSSFRFQTTLLNGTAMTRDDDIPVSYLNKRQIYKISVRDLQPERQSNGAPTTYRTYIRVFFHEDKQRANPDQHWQLWKEGRGLNEAPALGGKLQAIEYVPSSGLTTHTTVHLEKSAFDSFCITWTAPNSYQPECELQFRCNFLSTDFSRSKGVKGTPVRLCAKSEVVGLSDTMAPPSTLPEVCYCKIKLFRDHGAERKLTNDESALRRLMQKTEQQLTQGGNDNASVGDKRRASEDSPVAARPAKMARLARGSSVSSSSSQDIAEGDLSLKLLAQGRLLRSRRDITVFALRGTELDDPDVNPVILDDSTQVASDSPEIKSLERRRTLDHGGPLQIGLQIPSPVTSHQPSNETVPAMKHELSVESTGSNPQHLASPPKILGSSTKVSLGRKSIDALGIDNSYEPPQRTNRPVACFYIKVQRGTTASNAYFATYLTTRTAPALIKAIAAKSGMDPADITDALQVTSNGLRVKIDDDLVAHMPEGQDALAEFVATSPSAKGRRPRFSLLLHF